MSRIGRKPITIPSGVEVSVDGNKVAVKGPLGTLEREFHTRVTINKNDGEITVSRLSDAPKDRALHGLSRTLLNNMVTGVTQGFAKTLEIVGIGYRATKQGRKLTLSVGYSHPVEVDPPPGLEIEVPTTTRIIVKGTDKEKVGQLAAFIRKVREPEPYKGKGIRYEGESLRRKAGKAGSKVKK